MTLSQDTRDLDERLKRAKSERDIVRRKWEADLEAAHGPGPRKMVQEKYTVDEREWEARQQHERNAEQRKWKLQVRRSISTVV